MEKCAFELGENECSALTIKECNKCGFYKTKEQVELSRARTEARLDSIPGGLYLYKKYHCSGRGKNE